MADYSASVKVKLQDNFSASAKAVARSAQKVNKSTSAALNKTKKVGQSTFRTFDKVRKSTDKATKSLQKMRSIKFPGGVLGGVVSTAALAMEARRVASLEERYGRLGIQAEVTDAKMSKMRTNLEKSARDVNIAPTELLSALEQIVEKTGDLKFASEQLENMAKAIQATGSSGIDIGATLAEFQKMGVTDPIEIKKMIDTLILQGKKGSFTLEEFASQSSKLFPSITAYGFKGEKAIEQLGSIGQVARMGTGSADEATTSINSLLKTLSVKEDELNNSGIKTKNEDGTVRDVTSIVEDLMILTKGNVGKLTDFFGDEGYKAIKYLIDGYKTTGKVNAYDTYTSIKGDGLQLDIDTYRAMNFMNAKVQTIKNAKDKESDKYLGYAINKVAGMFDSLTDSSQQLDSLRDAAETKKMFRDIDAQVRAKIAKEDKQTIEIKLKKSPDLKVESIKTPSKNIGIIVEDN